MEPHYLTTVFFHFWLMKYSQPGHRAGLSPGQEITQMFLRFWDWIEVLTQNLSVWQHLTV